MEQHAVYQELKDYLNEKAYYFKLLDEKVLIKGQVLSAEEAIGNPQREDFPLIKGKEKLLQAKFKGATGQAFTDSPGSFEGTLKEFLNIPLHSNFQKAAFTAILNAVTRYLEIIEGTIHCKDNEPNECAEKLVDYLHKKFTYPKIALIGFQPALLDYCGREFPVRAVDLNLENIGKKKYGVLIEDAELKTEELIEWCNLVLVTGSTLANGTIADFLELDKKVIFYGTTIAAAAQILRLERFCGCAK